MFGVLVVVCMLCFASPTFAASAWVLWAEDFRYDNPTDSGWGTQTTDWALLHAFADETTCKRERGLAMLEVLANLQSDKYDVLYKMTDTMIKLNFFPKNAKPTDTIKHAQTIRYVCLPDTIDPRTPKH
jgi:hypothetical protein